MTEDKWLPDGRQWLWSAHSLDLAETCARRYYYEVKLNLTTNDQNVHAFFGIEMHKAIESYEAQRANGIEHNDALRTVVRDALIATWRDGQPMLQHSDLKLLAGSAHLKTRENLIRTIIWYLEEYGLEDPCRTVMLKNDKPAVELPFSFELDKDIMLRGRMDRLVEYAGNTYVHDSKTTGSQISSYYFKRFDVDTEMHLYSLAARVVFDSPVNGVLIDAMQIAVGFSRFDRSITFRSANQLSEWTQHAKYHIEQTWEAEAKGWPMRLSSCQKYGGCPFMEVCRRDPAVREDYLRTHYVTREYDGSR